MTYKKIIWGIISLVVLVFLVILFLQLRHLATAQRVDDVRAGFDTVYFTGKNHQYNYLMQSEIIKTKAYAQYRQTRRVDSLIFYLHQAELEAMRLLNKEPAP